MAVTAGVAGRGLWIMGGVVAGVLGACVVALFTTGLSELFGGSGQEVFNAGILGFAVLMLTWHNVWMSRHGRELVAELRAAGEAVAAGFVGLILGSSVCLLTYLGLITIPTRYLFSVTSALIALLAAGMAAQAIAFLEQADIVTALDQTVWDTSWILSDSSFLGRALHTLVGYVDQPTAMQLLVYLATLGTIAVLMKLFASPSARQPHAA